MPLPTKVTAGPSAGSAAARASSPSSNAYPLDASSGSTTSDPSPAAPTEVALSNTPTDTPTDSTDSAAAACFARPSSQGDIIQREKDPTLLYSQGLGKVDLSVM